MSARDGRRVDLLVEGTVVAMDRESRVIRDGAVAVAGDRIVAVGPADEVRASYSAGRVLGGRRRFVLPGFVDCHNHLGQALVREAAFEDLPNVSRLYMPAEVALSGDDARVSAQLAVAQLLRAGVTTVAETTCTVAHEEPIAETVMAAGIRCALARGEPDRRVRLAGIYDQPDGRSWYEDDSGRMAEDLAVTEEFLRRWQDRGEGRVRPWVHTLASSRCSDEKFMRSKELAKRYGTGVMHHANRDREEIELSIALFGERPIEHLNRIGGLDERLLVIHAMLTTDREIQMLARAGTKVAHAPVVCGDILSAITKVPEMRAAGVTVGLGCDTVINDLLAVMRLAFFTHVQNSGIKLYDPLSFTAEDALTMATVDGARALLWDDEIGSLEVGKAADITIVNADNLRLTPAHNPIGILVRYAQSTDVETVVVAGRVVVDDGRVLTIDEETVLDEASQLSARLYPDIVPRRYRPLTVAAKLD